MWSHQFVDSREQVFHLRVAQSILGLCKIQLIIAAPALLDEALQGGVCSGHVVVDPLRPVLVAVEADEEDDGVLCKVSSEDLLQVPEHLALALGEAPHLEHQQEDVRSRKGQSQAVLDLLQILHPVLVPQLGGVHQDERLPCCKHLLSLTGQGGLRGFRIWATDGVLITCSLQN